MLWAIAGLFLMLWTVGFVTAHTLGGFLHILLVLVGAVVLLHLVKERRAST